MATLCEDCGLGQRGGFGGQKLCRKCRIINGTKVCTACGIEKPFSAFVAENGGRGDGRNVHCRPCRPNTHSMRVYGLTAIEADAIRGRGCEVCGSNENVHIDHCHDSNVVRGALCVNCNIALGQCRDDPTRLRALADYAEQHAHLKVS